jgi:hypothetical protein
MFVPRPATTSKPRETVTADVISRAYRAGTEGEGKLFDRSALMGFSLGVVASNDVDNPP